MFLKFGEIPVVVASSREAAREIMKTHDAIFATRPQTPTIKVVTEGIPGLVFEPYGDQWRQLRKICMVELLSTKRVQSFRPVREDEAIRLIRSVSSSSPIRLDNVSELLTSFVMDVSVRCIMGDLLKQRDTFLRELDKDMKLLSGFRLTDLFPSSRLVRMLNPISREAQAHHKVVMELMDEVLREHMERRNQGGVDREDLIDVLVRLQKEDGVPTTGAIRGLVHDLFSAGSETAAVTLHWAMAELIRNPDKMKKAQEQVRAVFSTKMTVTEEGLDKLSYLHKVIQETLRLHPPGTLLVPRECSEQCQVLGYDVPKGAMVVGPKVLG